MAGLKLNTQDVKRLAKDIDNAIDDSMDDTFSTYRKNTPKRNGYARRNTKLTKRNETFSIKSNYDYAGRLDEGWSKQAPRGFTSPSFKFLKKRLAKYFKRI